MPDGPATSSSGLCLGLGQQLDKQRNETQINHHQTGGCQHFRATSCRNSEIKHFCARHPSDSRGPPSMPSRYGKRNRVSHSSFFPSEVGDL